MGLNDTTWCGFVSWTIRFRLLHRERFTLNFVYFFFRNATIVFVAISTQYDRFQVCTKYLNRNSEIRDSHFELTRLQCLLSSLLEIVSQCSTLRVPKDFITIGWELCSRLSGLYSIKFWNHICISATFFHNDHWSSIWVQSSRLEPAEYYRGVNSGNGKRQTSRMKFEFSFWSMEKVLKKKRPNLINFLNSVTCHVSICKQESDISYFWSIPCLLKFSCMTTPNVPQITRLLNAGITRRASRLEN